MGVSSLQYVTSCCFWTCRPQRCAKCEHLLIAGGRGCAKACCDEAALGHGHWPREIGPAAQRFHVNPRITREFHCGVIEMIVGLGVVFYSRLWDIVSLNFTLLEGKSVHFHWT